MADDREGLTLGQPILSVLTRQRRGLRRLRQAIFHRYLTRINHARAVSACRGIDFLS
jgi:hypothetical protein